MSKRGKRIWSFLSGSVLFIGGAVLAVAPQGSWDGDGAAPHPLPYILGMSTFGIGFVLAAGTVLNTLGSMAWRLVTAPRRRALRKRKRQALPEPAPMPTRIMDEAELRAWQKSQSRR